MLPSKYSTTIAPRAKMRVSHIANVENATWMQDWPVEVADARRVEEFLRLYQTEALDSEEKRALMALIVCSYDECDKGDEQSWSEIREILIAEAKLHAGLIVYWSCVAEAENGSWYFEPDEHCFYITPRMRSVLRQVLGEIGFWELKMEHPAIPRGVD